MKPSVYLVSVALLIALMCAACAASQPKAPSSVADVRVRIVNEGNTHSGETSNGPTSEAISAAIERAFQQSLSKAGLRVVSRCEDDNCAEIEARISSESWTEEESWDEAGAQNAQFEQDDQANPHDQTTQHGQQAQDPESSTNARATVTLVNVSNGEVLGQGYGESVIARSAQVHPYGTNHIANSALAEAFESPMIAQAKFGGKTTAAPAAGGEAQAGQADDDAAFSHVGHPQPTAYALVIGIEAYRDLPATTGSRADATAFVELLQNSLGVPEENIRTLIDDRATKSDLEAAVRWVQNNVPKKGRVYLYFSGHGAPDPTTGEGYLLPYEAKSNNIAHGGLAIEEVLNNLGKSEAAEVLAFVDSCFSGEGERSVLEEGIRPVVPVQQPDASDKTVLFSASGAKEISGTTAEGTGGLFTHHLLAAIGNGQADIDGDGSISLGELQSYVEPRVAREAKKLSRDQHPTLSVGDALASPDDFLLVWGLSASR